MRRGFLQGLNNLSLCTKLEKEKKWLIGKKGNTNLWVPESGAGGAFPNGGGAESD